MYDEPFAAFTRIAVELQADDPNLSSFRELGQRLEGIVAPWILALAVCTLLAGRALSLVRLASSVVVSQLLFHTLFVMGSPSASSTTSCTSGP